MTTPVHCRQATLADLPQVLAVLEATPIEPWGFIWLSLFAVRQAYPWDGQTMSFREHGQQFTSEWIRRWLKTHALPSGCVQVAVLQNAEEGFDRLVAVAIKKGNSGLQRLRQVSVFRECQRQGIGSALLEHTIASAGGRLTIFVAERCSAGNAWLRKVIERSPRLYKASDREVTSDGGSGLTIDVGQPPWNQPTVEPHWQHTFSTEQSKALTQVREHLDRLKASSGPVRSLRTEPPCLGGGRTVVRISTGELIYVPRIVYGDHGELENASSLYGGNEVTRAVALALGTRHHSGYFRESCMRRLKPLAFEELVAYAALLLGEQVREVAMVAAEAIDEAPDAWVASFVRLNTELVNRIEVRTISYGNEYYRGTAMPNYKDYPPYACVQRMRERARRAA